MSNSRPRVVLIRHGETAWSRDRRHTGRTDIPLTPHGEGQAAALASRLAGWTFSQALVSPLSRATRTAELAGICDAKVDPDLAEWDYGDYEGRTTSAIREDHPGWDLLADVVCVAHAHLLRVLAVRWLGVDPVSARYLVLGPASVSVLGWEREQSVIEHWNT